MIHRHLPLWHRLYDLNKGQRFQITQFMGGGGQDKLGFPQFVPSESGQTGFSSSKFGKFHIVCKKKNLFFFFQLL